MPHPRRVLIIGADGLRPDLVDPKLMTTYARLISEGTRFTEFYAAYPPHTRVNMATFTTGVKPGRHGVVANLMLVPGAGEGGLLDTSNDAHLRGFEAQTGEPLLLAPTLGDRLHSHGSRLAVAASSSPGASLLWNLHHPERVLNPASHYGHPDLLALHEKLGVVPPEKGRTKFERARWATHALIDTLLDDPDNQVMVLWLSEPDSSQHFYGLGSPEAQEALRVVDECLGLVLVALERKGLLDETDLLLVSDHGHSTVDAHCSLSEHLAAAARELGLRQPFMVVGDLIYSAPNAKPSGGDLEKLVRWLNHQPWCDLIFVGEGAFHGLPGTLPLGTVTGEAVHGRAPLLSVSAAWSHDVNEHGVPGRVSALTSLAALKSTHGAASPYDLHAFCLGYGPSFRTGVCVDTPCGTTDVAPTVCWLLGLADVDFGVFDGRVLEAGVQAQPSSASRVERLAEAAEGRQRGVRLGRVGNSSYLLGSVKL